MLIDGFPAEMFATNCWVIAPAAGEECFVVDPGIANPDANRALGEILTRHRLKPVAVIATHGHLDHTFSIGPVCGARGIPAYIHSADRSSTEGGFWFDFGFNLWTFGSFGASTLALHWRL